MLSRERRMCLVHVAEPTILFGESFERKLAAREPIGDVHARKQRAAVLATRLVRIYSIFELYFLPSPYVYVYVSRTFKQHSTRNNGVAEAFSVRAHPCTHSYTHSSQHSRCILAFSKIHLNISSEMAICTHVRRWQKTIRRTHK